LDIPFQKISNDAIGTFDGSDVQTSDNSVLRGFIDEIDKFKI